MKALPSRGEAFQEGLKASASLLDDLQCELPRLHVLGTKKRVPLLHFL